MQEVYQDEEPFYVPIDLSYLEDWVFHFNSFTEQWAAIPRGLYNEYWNDYKNPNILRSKSLDTLLELLHKSKGDTKLIEKITSGKTK
jgi:hypothetical protein